jgi:hypothetical protein
MYSKTDYQEALKTGWYRIIFTKADGSQRLMLGTLDPAYLPKKPLEEGHVPRKENDQVVNVWDTQADGWRSFRVDSVILFEPFNEVLGG